MQAAVLALCIVSSILFLETASACTPFPWDSCGYGQKCVCGYTGCHCQPDHGSNYCWADWQCGPWQKCVYGSCVYDHGDGQYCRYDYECRPWQVCRYGKCTYH